MIPMTSPVKIPTLQRKMGIVQSQKGLGWKIPERSHEQDCPTAVEALGAKPTDPGLEMSPGIAQK